MPSFRVLIVDNQRSVRRSLRSGLESTGQDFEVLEATSGEEAMLAFASLPVDLLVTGVRLAGMSGLELLQRMRQNRPELKGILTAVNPDTRTGQLALKANANALVPKPIDISKFLEAVYRCLDQEPERGLPPKQQATSAGSLSERLEAIYQRCGAMAILLLDEDGHILAQAGEAEKAKPLMSQIPVVLEALGASARLSQAMGENIPDDLVCCAGLGVELFAAHLGKLNALLYIFDTGVLGYTRARSVRLVSESVLEMTGFMPMFGGSQRSMLAKKEEPTDPRPKKEAETNVDLDEVFQQASKNSLDPQDVDGFWETAVDQPDSDSGAGPDSISYDQAKDMGLVQDG